MKKEASKKSKLWLWLTIGIVALLAVAGTVLALVLGGGQSNGAPDRPEIYWNLDREQYVPNGAVSSSREKAEDGFFHINFAYNGAQKEVLTSDKQLVNYIDSMNAMGLVFDGDGYVVDAVEIKEIATVVKEDVYVQTVQSDKIVTNSSVVMNGMKAELLPSDKTEIYDVTTKAQTPGEKITLEQLSTMDKLSAFANAQGEITHIFVTSHARTSKVYWRANQFVSSNKTTREPDENGCYTIPFYCEGERVEFKCKNVVEVNYIDKQSRYSAHFGLVFDEEGYIEEAILSYEAIRGMIRSERYDVTGIDGNQITTTKVIGSNAGTTDTFTIGENCPIYDVSPAAVSEDRAGKTVESLQLGDRIVCFADAEGKPLFVYVAERIVADAHWCYSLGRKYDSTLKETTREPDGDGWYVFEVFTGGKVLKVKTRDKAVATEIDAVSSLCFGLTLNGDEIVEVYTVYSVFGYGSFCQGRYVTDVTGSIFACIKSATPDKPTTGILGASCKIYNLSEVGTYGELTKLQKGDYIYAYQDPNLQIVEVFVLRRMVDAPIYYSLSRKYDATNKVTTREPDENGWYVYDVAVNGKRTTVKTRSKALATKMDAFSPAAMTLVVGSDGVVQEAYSGQVSTGGSRRASGYKVVSINTDGTVDTVYEKTGATRKLTLADYTKVYNVSQVFSKVRGEATTLRVGDIITSFNDIYDKAAVIFVRTRETDKLYWNSERLYDDTNGVSTRILDAEGWYIYNLTVDGKLVTLKTQDKAIADSVDYYGGAFTLSVDGDVITGVGSPSLATKCAGTNLLNYDVVKVEGRKVTLQYNVEGSAKYGELQTITLNSDARIYDVSPTAAQFGAPVALQVGDRVRAYLDDRNDNYHYIYIRFHDTHQGGAAGYCEVCKKDVYWNPWMGGSFSTAGGHFYLNASMQTPNLPGSVGRSSYPVSTVCLDLNGNTYNRITGRALYVYENATLNILDTAGGGAVISGGINNGTSGGVLGIPGGTVNLYGGTLQLAQEHLPQERGGVVYIAVGGSEMKTPGTLNMYGGTITGGEVTDRGGNVAISGGVFNLYGGLVENGKAENRGGNIVTMSNGSFHMYGGTVSGGTVTNGAGGNIYGGTGVVTIAGGTVSGGTSKEGGGNLYVLEALTISGGTIADGISQKKSGGNVYISNYSDNTSLTITGGTITGGKCEGYGGNIYTEVGAAISGATIENGTSAKDGGNIYCGKSTTVTGTTIAGGKAPNGGNLYGGKDWTITDSVIVGGTATDAKGSGGNIYASSGEWTLVNTTVSGGVSGARGGNIYSAGAGITLESGTIAGGTSGSGNANGGGNVCTVSNGSFTMNGGSVLDGTSVNTGGNILSGSGKLHINGGTVSGGTASKGGADIYIYGGATDVTIAGGELGVVDATAVNFMELTGTPKIGQLTMGSGVCAQVDDLKQGAEIGIIAEGVFTLSLGEPDSYIGYFTVLQPEYSLYVEGDALALAAGIREGYCSHCDTTVTWKLWSGKAAEGHFYMDADYVQTETYGIKIPEGSTVVLDLAGKKITGDKVRAFDVSGDFVLMDTAGTGEVVTGGVEEADSLGGVIRARKGSFTMLGGTLRLADDHSATIKQGGVIYIDKTCHVTIKDGTVMNGVTTERGGNIFLASGGGKLTVEGGLITNGTAGSSNNGGGNIAVLSDSVVEIRGGMVSDGTSPKSGGNILATGNLVISGGEITGGTAAVNGNNIYAFNASGDVTVTGGTIESLSVKQPRSLTVSGEPVIGALELASGDRAVIGALGEGASIAFAAEGTFAESEEDLTVCIADGRIKMTDADKRLVFENGELSVQVLMEGEKIAYCQHCEAEVSWFLWNGEVDNAHYYLAEDYNLTETYGIKIPEGSTTVLDLAGFDMIGDKVRAFDISGNFVLMDTVGTGEVVTGGVEEADSLGGVIRARKGSFTLLGGTLRLADDHSATIKQGGVIYVDKTCHVTIKDGTVMNGVTTERGGNIFVAGSNTAGGGLTVEGGTITGGTANSSNSNGGGNIAVLTGSTVEIKGGTISNGRTTKTAGNILATGNLVISGGEIFGGEADKSAKNIYVFNNSGDVTVTGGTIESLTAKQPKSLTISGDPVIGELELLDGQLVTLGQLEETAEITVKADGVFVTGNPEAEAYVNVQIKCTDRNEIQAENGQLSVGYASECYCDHCEQNVTWSEWDGTSVNGHHYLSGNVSYEQQVSIAAGNELVLDLNGYTITATAGRAFEVKGKLAVLDYAGSGKITAKGIAGNNGGVLYVSGGSFDLYAGTLALAAEHEAVKRGGVMMMDGAAVVNLKGGILENGVTTDRGGNIYVGGGQLFLSGAIVRNGYSESSTNSNGGGNIFMLGSSVVTMTDGKVIDGRTDKTGGNICVGTATFIMEGGEIFGGSAAVKAPDVYVYYNASNAQIKGGYIENLLYTDSASFQVSGNPVIDNFEIAAGKVFTLGELTEGAAITVTAEGAFTTANANAADFVAKEYIKAAGENTLTEAGGVLSVTAPQLLRKLASFFASL